MKSLSIVFVDFCLFFYIFVVFIVCYIKINTQTNTTSIFSVLILNENQRQTKKLAAGCSKHCFEVVDKTDEVSSKHGFEVVDETDEVSNHTYGKTTLTWFEEIFEEYKN